MRAQFNYLCGIDTMEIISPTFYYGSIPCFTFDNVRRVVANYDEYQLYAYRFSPYSQIGNQIYSFSNCVNFTEWTMREANLEIPEIRRIDFCFDDFHNEYRDLYKLNHLLFYIIAKKYNISNDFSSCGIKSPVLKTLRIQNSRLEAEFYNKAEQEPNGIVKCRLELRSKRVNCQVGDTQAIEEELRKWLNILKSVTKLKARELNSLLNDLNDKIMHCYKEDVARRDYDKMDFNSVIQRYNRYIFTRRQLGEIFRLMDYKSYQSMASKYKDTHKGLEFFNLSDLQNYVNHIIIVAEHFLML